MKKIISSLMFFLVFVSFVSATTTQINDTENGHSYKVMKVVLDGKSKIVVGVAPNYTPAQSLKSLMENMGGTHAINGGFFCPDETAYSRCNRGTSDLIRISNGTLYSIGGKHVRPYRAVFGFDTQGAVLPLATNDDKYYANGTWENKNLDKMSNGLMMPMLVQNGVNVAVLFDEMNNDPKQGKVGNKTFICSTQDNSTIYMGYVDSVTFSSLADYIITTFDCYNAIQLDNGGTKAMIYNNNYVAGPGRAMRDAFIIIEGDGIGTEVTPITPVVGPTNEELQTAITWMYNQGLTMYDNISQFLPNNTMTREEASKFFGVFAQKEYSKIEDSTKKCTFYDINKADPTLKNNIINACRLGIFQGYKNNFTPLDKLNNAQAVTVMMRIMVGMMAEPTNAFYTNYFLKAKEFGLISNILPNNNITRGEAALLIYKAHLYKENNDVIVNSPTTENTDIDTTTSTNNNINDDIDSDVIDDFDYDICITSSIVSACIAGTDDCPSECMDTYTYSSSTSNNDSNINDNFDYTICYDYTIIPSCVSQSSSCPNECLDRYTYTSTTTYDSNTNTTTTVNHINAK